MRDLPAVDRQLAELGPTLERRQVAALLDRLLGSDRSLQRLNELLDGLGGSTPLQARPAALRDPLGGPSPRPAFGERPRSDPPAGRAPNPPGVRGSLPPRIVSPLAPVQGDSLKTATPWPPVTSSVRSSRDTLVDAAQPAPAMPKVDEQELDAETAALFGVTMPPAASPELAAAAFAAAAPAPMTPAEAAALSSSPPPVVSSLPPPAAVPAPAAERSDSGSGRPRNTLQWNTGVDSAPPAEPAAANSPVPPAAAPASDPSSRVSTRELLEQELDPREFPSSYPPPRARSLPPPVPDGPPQRPTAEAKDSFEMLIDDSEEDIMEIDDVELEEIE